jgi:hypothetical protein
MAGRQDIPVFDTREVTNLLARPGVLEYLARMLASFTRIQTYTIPVRVRRGVRRRIRYNNMDIDSLMRFCATADEKDRLSFYRRIADVCLFITGIFPDFTPTRLVYRTQDRCPAMPARLRSYSYNRKIPVALR